MSLFRILLVSTIFYSTTLYAKNSNSSEESVFSIFEEIRLDTCHCDVVNLRGNKVGTTTYRSKNGEDLNCDILEGNVTTTATGAMGETQNCDH